MHPHAQLIERFYAAFAERDAEGMARCYHPQVQFSDPVFQQLRGERAAGMWRMLTERGKDLRIDFSRIEADEQRGKAHWEAHYTFSATGHQVHNIIDATFEFADGLIVKHDDHFNFWRWASQALGLKGRLLGWLPPVRDAVSKQAMVQLDRFLERQR